MESVLSLARKAGAHLTEKGFENGRHEAERMLARVLGMRRLDLYLQHDRPVTVAELEAFRTLVRRRLRGEPLQYVLGETGFRRVVLQVDRRVLIPRPETEILVGEVVAWAGPRGANGGMLDLGTGSGAIAISLLAEGAFARAVATDTSSEALEVAAANARAAGVGVEFRCGALYDALRAGERFDAIVSNPPYVAERDRASLPPEVREWEPAQALFAGPDGLDVLEAIVDGAAARLVPGGLLAVEVGAGQAGRVVERIERSGVFRPPRIVRDLAGHERVVLAESQDGNGKD